MQVRSAEEDRPGLTGVSTTGHEVNGNPLLRDSSQVARPTAAAAAAAFRAVLPPWALVDRGTGELASDWLWSAGVPCSPSLRAA